MTRRARVIATQNKRPFPTTLWENVKKGSFEGQHQNLPKSKQLEANRLCLKNDAPQAKHKKNKKKKVYLNEDVNGLMEHLRQNSQMVNNGEMIATVRKQGKKLNGHWNMLPVWIHKCKVQIDPALGELPFSKCFVCGEMGHLKIVLKVRTQIKWSQLVTGAKGMSADYEEILDVPKPQKPKTNIPKVVNF
uniref:Uncharacterized protein n=1 Tax=Moschus moschiferus TaxID=68415 RepID=A0A8C6FP18_MOSMO